MIISKNIEIIYINSDNIFERLWVSLEGIQSALLDENKHEPFDKTSHDNKIFNRAIKLATEEYGVITDKIISIGYVYHKNSSPVLVDQPIKY